VNGLDGWAEQGVLAIPSGVIATCFALVCFAAALLVGLFAGNPALTILWRSLLVMLGAWVVGRVVGAVVQSALDEHLKNYRDANPLPGGEHTATTETTPEPETQPEAPVASTTN
jgi:hypothetical protein